MNQDWDDDEPPTLGEDGNQTADHETKVDDSNVMDEMMAIAQRAKEDKRRQQEKERNRRAFGQGLKKGFFNSPASDKNQAKPTKRSTTLEPALHQSREERLRIVNQNEEKTADADKPKFVFPEVQEAMKSMHQLDPKEWMNERFFEKLSRHPKLAQALQNPAFTSAIAEMQQDPQAAILKYQKDRAVSTMLRDFMEFLGSHFEELGKEPEAAGKNAQQQQPDEPGRREPSHPVKPNQQQPPSIVDLDEARRKAIADMKRSPEEEEQVQRILNNPELLTALSDAKLMERLQLCRQSPEQLQQLALDPELGPKLRLLVQHNMVQFA